MPPVSQPGALPASTWTGCSCPGSGHLKLFQKADVVFQEKTQVVHLVLEQGDPVDSDAPSETGVPLRIVTNSCYDELRRRKRRPAVPLEPYTDDDEIVESPSWIADPGESPEEHALRMELSLAIQNCLDGLAADFRLLVVLVDIQGMDYAEAAGIIKKPLGTVKSRLARARTRLRDCLQGFGELLPATFRLEEESTP